MSPVITRLTTRVATASSLVCRLNSAHQRPNPTHQERGRPSAGSPRGVGAGRLVAAGRLPLGLLVATVVGLLPLGLGEIILGTAHLVTNVAPVGDALKVHQGQAGVGSRKGGVKVVALGHHRQHPTATGHRAAIG